MFNFFRKKPIKVMRDDAWSFIDYEDFGFFENEIKPFYKENDFNIKLVEKIINLDVEEYYPKGKSQTPNLSKNKEFIFVHIPKNAGRSISNSLGIEYEDEGHRSLMEIKNTISTEIYENAIKFAVVRNPFERIVSLYSFRMIEENWEYPIDYNPNLTFEEWWFNPICRFYDRLYPPNCVKNPMYNMTKDENGDIGVDFILRYENLSDDWCNMFLTLNKTVPNLSVFNNSNHNKYHEYYNGKRGSQIKDVIYKNFKYDLKYFNYEF